MGIYKQIAYRNSRIDVCRNCQGEGITQDGICPVCNGKGRVRRTAEGVLTIENI